MTQLDLFQASSRRTDNAASHAAAERVESSGAAGSQRAACLEAVARFPGHTSKELAALAGLERHKVARRLPELHVAGLLRREDLEDGWHWFPVEVASER